MHRTNKLEDDIKILSLVLSICTVRYGYYATVIYAEK